MKNENRIRGSGSGPHCPYIGRRDRRDCVELVHGRAGIWAGHDRPARTVPMLNQRRAQSTLGVIGNADCPNIIFGESGDAVQFVDLPGTIGASDNLPTGRARRVQTKHCQT